MAAAILPTQRVALSTYFPQECVRRGVAARGRAGEEKPEKKPRHAGLA